MKRLRVLSILVLLLSIVTSTAFASNITEKTIKADTVYIHGNIYTVDEQFSKANAMAIKGQKLIYVGENRTAKNYIGPNTEVIDLKGKTVIPGLNDGHLHFPRIGTNLLKVNGFNKPKEEILNLVKEEANRLKPGEWILGYGWNHELWPDKKFPTKEELDAVAPNNPVALTRVDAHSIWVNSKALEIGGITKDTPNPQGGEILRAANGEPSGILIDTAGTPVSTKIPPYSTERMEEGLLKAQEELFKNGITSATDAGSHLSDINDMKNLYKQGDLKVRLNVMVSNGEGGATGEDLEYYYKHGPEIGLFDNSLTVRSVKLVGDGSLGSRSAALLEDYSDRSGHKGNYRFTDEELYRLVKEANKNGWQVGTHAIGDGSIEQVINVYERVLMEDPLKDHRWKIEHFQIANASEIERIAKLGILPSMQPVHATSDKNMAEDRVGPERIKYSYAWRKVIDAGSNIVGGSDAPVELVNPFHGLYAAVTRMDNEGNPDGGWYSEESMTREEALKAFTIWAAEGSFEEKIKGSLEVGKLADFIVVDRDPMECPEEQLKDIQTLTTVLGGKVVYKK